MRVLHAMSLSPWDAFKQTVARHLQAVRGVTHSSLSGDDALAACVVCVVISESKSDLLSMVLTGPQSCEEDVRHAAAPLTWASWHTLLNPTLYHLQHVRTVASVRAAEVGGVLQQASCRELCQQLRDALRCTLSERAPHEAFCIPFVQLACVVALHCDAFEERIKSCLGELVHADTRRLEELHSAVTDDGTDDIMLLQCIMRLSAFLVSCAVESGAYVPAFSP